MRSLVCACVAVAAVSALQPVSRRNGLKHLASGGAALAPLLYPAAAEAAFGKPKALTKKQLAEKDALIAEQAAQSAELRKKSGGKKSKLTGITKLDDANFAGKKNHAHKCTLILTEGDSAKAMAMAGLSVVGRDYYGVFPLRGKMINTREKMTTVKGTDQVNANAEIVNLKKILGLEQGKRYTTQDDINKNLRYGKVMIMTDQDVDGSHIKGLFMNWIDSQWSDLIALGFVTAMITPIIKAKKGKKEQHAQAIKEELRLQQEVLHEQMKVQQREREMYQARRLID